MDSAIIVAAGSGTRLGGIKKQFLNIGDYSVLYRSFKKLSLAGAEEIVVVTSKEDVDKVKDILHGEKHLRAVVEGGKTRQESVKNGFLACSKDNDLILIHDAARPFVKIDEIKNVMSVARKTGAATLGAFVVDTIKTLDGSVIEKTLDRDKLFSVYTPQVFSKSVYKSALENFDDSFTDDCSLVEASGTPVHAVVGSRDNIKITTKEDIEYAKFLAQKEDLL